MLEDADQVVDAEAIADQQALERKAKHGFEHLATTALGDEIEGAARVGKDPEPSEGAADPPTGFVDMDHRSLAELGLELVVLWSEAIGHPGQGLAETARGEVEAEMIAQDRAGFAQSQVLGFT